MTRNLAEDDARLWRDGAYAWVRAALMAIPPAVMARKWCSEIAA